MPIINYSGFPYIQTTPLLHDSNPCIEYRPDTAYWSVNEWKDGAYWYCEIKNGNAFDAYQIASLIPAETLTAIREDNTTFLVVCNSHEAFHAIVDPLYTTLVLKEKIPPHKIMLISESADIHNVVKAVAHKYNVGYMHVTWIRIFERSSALYDLMRKTLPGYKPLQTLSFKSYPKAFINFNRRWRPHRPAIVALLCAMNLLDRGYVSLAASDDNITWDSVYWWIEQSCRSDTTLSALLARNKSTIMNLPPLYIDTTELMSNKAILDAKSDKLYEDTYFSVVTETNYYTSTGFEHGRFLSEKTFKPIVNAHPFIIASVPGTLQLLRDIGYKTFSPWIDERYDVEYDDTLRLKKIMYEIHRLVNLTPTELHAFLIGVRPIVKYNYEVLTTRSANQFGAQTL